MPQSQRKAPAPERDPIAERHWVEQLAMLLEAQGGQMPRTAGRILALMLISDAASMTQAELADALSVSQASISPAVRHLIGIGYVERTRTPGVRGDQYMLREQSWSAVLHSAILGQEALVSHLELGAQLPGPQVSAGRKNLASFTNLYRNLGDLLREVADRVDGIAR
jgi:hypothetical protein